MSKELTLGYVPYGTGVVRPFDTIFPKAIQVSPDDIRAGKVDALVIWGGADISPTIYGMPVEPGCGADEHLSHRDQVEVGVVDAAIQSGVPILGVCRGAQLLCAMAGGTLYQDVHGHFGDHEITTHDGKTYVTSSVHHQMMNLEGLKPEEAQLLAWSTKHRTKPSDGVEGEEPEVVYFPKIKGLAIQGHPEFMSKECDFVAYSRQLVKEYLLK